jgi:aspartyl-tRNA(Asn)/glutamyl-tRNA(Gln) amidotransferase subunit C
MALSRKEVEDIAQLARLHLEAAELERMQGELAAILEHFGALAAADTEGVAAMTHAVPLELRLRADVAEPSLSVDDALAAAPVKHDGLFVVPAILPSGGDG